MTDRIGISFAMPPIRIDGRLSLRQKRMSPEQGWYVVVFSITLTGKPEWFDGDRPQPLTQDRAKRFVDARFCGERWARA